MKATLGVGPFWCKRKMTIKSILTYVDSEQDDGTQQQDFLSYKPEQSLYYVSFCNEIASPHSFLPKQELCSRDKNINYQESKCNFQTFLIYCEIRALC